MNEPRYWLYLCDLSDSYPSCQLLTELGVVIKTLSKIISTTKSK